MRFLFYFALPAKIKSGFWICYSAMLFGVVSVSLRIIWASTTSIACTASRILLAVFGCDRNLFRFYGFLLFFLYGFAVFNTLKCRPPFYHPDDFVFARNFNSF